MSDQPVCAICSDEGTPMRVIEVTGDGLACCEDAWGDRRDVMTTLVGEVRPDDRLLVHAGTALASLDPRDTARGEDR